MRKILSAVVGFALIIIPVFVFISLMAYAYAQGVAEVTPDTTESFVKDLMDALLSSSAGLSGWSILVGVLGTLVMFATRGIKIFLPAQWQSLKTIWKIVIPFACATLGTLAVGIAGAMAGGLVIKTVIGKLIAAAVAAGITAILGHHGTKAAGVTFDEMMLKRDPTYQPGNLRKKMSLLVDMPKIDKAKKKVGIVD